MKSILMTALLLLSVTFIAESQANENSKLLKMCKESTIPSYVPSCLSKFKNSYVDNVAIEACEKSTIPSYRPACVLKLVNMRFTVNSLNACKKSTIPSYVPKCLVQLANLNVTETDYNTCKSSTIPSYVPQCLVKISQGFSDNGPRKLLGRALKMIDSGDYARAKKLIIKARKLLE